MDCHAVQAPLAMTIKKLFLKKWILIFLPTTPQSVIASLAARQGVAIHKTTLESNFQKVDSRVKVDY